jgi:nucleoside-diphosphate-sugar epimerase
MIDIKNRRIVLIGGSGFIGHHLALGLKRKGANVQIIDSLQVNNLLKFAVCTDDKNRDLYYHFINERLNLLRSANIPVHVQDAREYHTLSHLLGNLNPQVIVHLAAVSHAGLSNKDPYSTFDHSVHTLENALDYARGNVEQFVYLSSSMIYGHFPQGHVTEETPCAPLGVYGALKYAGEKMVLAYSQVFDMPCTIVRPSALYGERCVSRRVVQIFIENAIRGEEVVVHGDGSDRLDFTYIGDFVQGIVKFIENEKARDEIFNLTYGESRTIGELSDILKAEFPGLKVTFKPKDKLTPDRGTLSVAKARDLIDYEPQFPIDKGLPRYIHWYRTLLETPGFENMRADFGIEDKQVISTSS